MVRRHIDRLDSWGAIEVEEQRLDVWHVKLALYQAESRWAEQLPIG
jgi:hypothetical protein